MMVGDVKCAAGHVGLLGISRQRSDIDPLRDLDGVIDLDAEVANGALDLRMSEQKLYGSEVPCAPVDQHSFRAA